MGGQGPSPGFVIAVTPYGGNRGYGRQLGQHLGRADVARVDDVIDALQHLPYSGIQMPVGIGQHAYGDDLEAEPRSLPVANTRYRFPSSAPSSTRPEAGTACPPNWPRKAARRRAA